jgi:predicted amidohydrolase
MIRRAASGEGVGGAQGKPDLIVLPECFNSPYGHVHFPVYAEPIEFKQGEKYNVEASKSESVKVLSEAAKTEGVWLLGGSIPEKDPSDDNVYNTSTVYSPQGELVAIHRKVHLFDIDIPGKITFKESETLTGGSTVNYFDTGKNIFSRCRSNLQLICTSRVCPCRAGHLLRCALPRACDDLGAPRLPCVDLSRCF